MRLKASESSFTINLSMLYNVPNDEFAFEGKAGVDKMAVGRNRGPA